MFGIGDVPKDILCGRRLSCIEVQICYCRLAIRQKFDLNLGARRRFECWCQIATYKNMRFLSGFIYYVNCFPQKASSYPVRYDGVLDMRSHEASWTIKTLLSRIDVTRLRVLQVFATLKDTHKNDLMVSPADGVTLYRECHMDIILPLLFSQASKEGCAGLRSAQRDFESSLYLKTKSVEFY